MKNFPMQSNFTDSQFQFSTMPIERLGATEYTLVTLAIDMSGSVSGFESELTSSIKEVVNACKKSSRAENLLLRLVTFNNNVYEEHGFKLIKDIQDSDYNQVIQPNGLTALYDATINSVDSIKEYGKTLVEQDFDVNGITIVVTDGMDNRSQYNSSNVKDSISDISFEEVLESMVTILVGVNTKRSDVQQYLNDYSNEGGFTQYVDVEDADANNLAKLANFISKSISNQSQSLGTGGPSQPLSF
ncbi:MAG: hypothetical protein CL760_00060 [Chloroflexi bacterium]|nr:hypothetical protein [Chloroflexota bacterium]